MPNITERTITGINWNIIRVFVLSVLRFSVMVVLARLIEPEYFGLISMATIFMTFIEYFSSIGIGPAIIQNKNLTKTYLSAAAYVSIITSVVAFIIIWFTSPYISIFFKDSRLTNILRVLSTVLVINGFQPVGIGLLMKEFKFKQLFIIDLSAYFFGYAGVSIVLAVLGYKIWGLVMGIIANQLVYLLLILIFSRFSLKPVFKLKEVKELLKFGKYFSIIGGFNYLGCIADSVVIGRYMPALQLGLYNRSSQLTNLPLTNFSETVSNVMFPAYSSVQNDLKKIERGFLSSLNHVTIVTIPLLIYMAVNSRYIMIGLFGPNWGAAAKALTILSVAGIFKSSVVLISPITKSTANVYSEAWRQLVFAVLITAGAIYAVRFGIEGVSLAVLISSVWLYFSMAQIAIRILKSTWKKFILSQLPGLFISIIIICLNIPINILMDNTVFRISYIYRFLIATFLYLIIYFSCIILLPEKIKGQVPKLIVKRYEKHFPIFFRNFLLKNLK
jgi:O-antigen/teichoic acid export membrane protein